MAAVRASQLVQRLERGSAVHLRVFSTSSDSVAIAVDLDPAVSIDATIPVSDGARASSYHLTARGVSELGVTVLNEGSRIVYIAPEWNDGFQLDDAHWVGPDLGFPPAGGG